MTETRGFVRQITTIRSTAQTTPLDPRPANLHEWLAQQARDYDLTWLLAHCEDGVIWGVYRDGKLKLSSDKDAFPSHGLALRWITLRQCRLFGANAELLLWHGPRDWHCTLRRDDEGEEVECIDEDHLLWGYFAENRTPVVKKPLSEAAEIRGVK
jgi:CRISPR-associated protein (TIGR03984 family)